MRLLVLGGAGMLGSAVVAAARERGVPALGPDRGSVDIRDGDAIRRALADFRADLLVNCAAFTEVDRCESERDAAFAVNGEAVAVAATAARDLGARFVQVSTDYVFDGEATTPYGEGAPVRPASVYGESKAMGERHALSVPDALVVRTSWLFGPGGPSFPRTILQLIDRGRVPLRVVDDQRGCPTYTPFLAAAILDLAAAGARGVVHYCNREPVTWFGFAREIVRLAAPGTEVVPVTTGEFPRPARRPAWSVLDVGRCESLLGRRVEPWLLGLAEFLIASRRRDP